MKVVMGVADELRLERLIFALRCERAVVDFASDACTLLDFLSNYRYEAVIVSDDVDGQGGRRMVRDLRARGKHLPILVFGPTDRQIRIDCLASGADDVISPDMDIEEVLARLRSLIRRSCGWSQASISLGNVVMNTDARSVSVDGISLSLTAKEYQIFELFMLRSNIVITKQHLIDRLYSGIDEPDDRIIGVFLCTLRRKLREAEASVDITTTRGVGYMLVARKPMSNASVRVTRTSRPERADLVMHQ
jgi:two-component system, cell cycle response regulator CtrA